MTIAELHGKLSATGINSTERLEDLLTSDVFGAFRYLRPEDGLIPFLKRVFGEKENCLDAFTTRVKASYFFWPRGRKNNREPDLTILLTEADYQIAITIEAKYYSGPSDTYDEKLQANRSQLADQYEDLMEQEPYSDRRAPNSWPSHNVEIKAPRQRRFLIYLTAESSRPDRHLDDAYDQLRERGDIGQMKTYPTPRDRLLWSSWHDVYETTRKVMDSRIRTHHPSDLIIEDLLLLLERKGFKSFTGFHKSTLSITFDYEFFWSEEWFSSIRPANLGHSASFFVDHNQKDDK